MFKYVCALGVFLFAKIASGQFNENSLPGCSKNEFECNDGSCVPMQDKCDSFPDCFDASDEDLLICINTRCPPKISFQCENGGCIEVEKRCDGFQNCLDGSDEDLDLCNYTSSVGRCPTYQFQCKRGGCIDRKNECDGREDCADGSDEDPIACNKNRFNKDRCHFPNTLTNAKCDVVNCTSGVYIGSCNHLSNTLNTCIELKCEEGNVLEDYRERFLSQCKNGVWEPELTLCQECGNEERVTPLISGTYDVKRPVPWYVGLYKHTENSTGVYHELFCGGSLIHSRAVITAAHCVIKHDAYGLPTVFLFPLNELRVAMGKMYRDYNANETFVQKFSVIHVSIHYYKTSLENDIAILFLDGKVKPSPDVMPVCIERNVYYYEDYKFKPGPTIFGKVAGFGRTEELDRTLSSVLKEASFQVCCNYIECRPKVGQIARGNVSPDKFCVEKLNGTAVEKGDSGGGFMVKRSNGRFYIYGVVSSKLESNNIRIFTSVLFHAHWLYKDLEVKNWK